MLDLGMAVIDDACDNAAEGEFSSDNFTESLVLCFDIRIKCQAHFAKLKSPGFVPCSVLFWGL